MKHLAFILVILLVGCGPSFPGEDELTKVHRIVTQRLNIEQHLLPCGTGASWPDKCHAIAYDFIYDSRVNISEARIHLLKAAHIITQSAESVVEFEQYLLNPPFSVKNIMLTIKFIEPCEIEGNDPEIKLASLMFGKIWYEVWNESTYRYETLHKETYEEALQIMSNQ